MPPKSKPQASLSRTAWDDLKRLPGNVRRLVTVAIDDLEQNPRPPNSKRLVVLDAKREARRVQLGHYGEDDRVSGRGGVASEASGQSLTAGRDTALLAHIENWTG